MFKKDFPTTSLGVCVRVRLVSSKALPWLAVNFAEARRWFRLAVDVWGDPDGSYELGRMLWRGEGASSPTRQQDAAGALALWQAASKQGQPDAQLAIMDVHRALNMIVANARSSQVREQ
jgi:TPR repeat protein